MKSITKILLIILSINFSNAILAAPKSELWSIWKKDNRNNQQVLDHSSWQKILDKYLVTQGQNNLFRYSAVTSADKTLLQKYINSLSKLDPRAYNTDVQFAYWVNIYNALTVNLILKNYPISSITKLGGLFSFGPWDKSIVKIAGQTLTLNDIEHRILRPIWQDDRIHYVVNCASIGCPNLSPTALTATNKEAELKKASIQFVNSSKGVSIKGNTMTLSSIYDWYAVDFGKNEKEILANIDRYRTGQKLQGWSGKIQYDYDWKLNESK